MIAAMKPAAKRRAYLVGYLVVTAVPIAVMAAGGYVITRLEYGPVRAQWWLRELGKDVRSAVAAAWRGDR